MSAHGLVKVSAHEYEDILCSRGDLTAVIREEDECWLDPLGHVVARMIFGRPQIFLGIAALLPDAPPALSRWERD